MAEVTFNIEKKLGVLSTTAKGWNKELNLVSWNGSSPKYDLRSWSSDNSQMSKGITLSKEEMVALKEILNSLQL